MSPTFKKKFKNKKKNMGFCVVCTLLLENEIKPSKQWLSLSLRLSLHPPLKNLNSKGESVPTP